MSKVECVVARTKGVNRARTMVPLAPVGSTPTPTPPEVSDEDEEEEEGEVLW